jgi:hypothetical protein
MDRLEPLTLAGLVSRFIRVRRSLTPPIGTAETCGASKGKAEGRRQKAELEPLTLAGLVSRLIRVRRSLTPPIGTAEACGASKGKAEGRRQSWNR